MGLHFGANVGGHIRSVEHGVETIARHLIGTQMKIEHAELKPHPRKIRVVVEDALEPADRCLVVAEFGLEFSIAECGVEIIGFEQLPLEQKVGDDALVRIGHGSRRGGGDLRWGGSAGSLCESCGGNGECRTGEAGHRR
jgi:hypothetical protein